MGKLSNAWMVVGVALGTLTSVPLGARAAAGCTLRVETIPVTMLDRAPVFDAKIDNHPVRFVLDSGADYSMLSSSVVAQYKLPIEPAKNIIVTGAGGQVNASIATVTFEVGKAKLYRAQFLASDFAPSAGSAGILGQNLFFKDDVEYDLANGAVKLIEPSHCAGAMAYWVAPGQSFSMVPIRRLDGDKFKTSAIVEINGHPFSAVFDTGAAVTFLTKSAAKKIGFDESSPGVIDAGYANGVGRRERHSWIMPVNSIKIGDESINHTKIRVGEFSSSISADMFIGSDFFVSHRVYVSNEQGKIYFTYNGGSVFDLTVTSTNSQASNSVNSPNTITPKTADEFARRGAASLQRRDLEHAIADFDEAHRLAPDNAEYLLQRAAAQGEAGNTIQAAADLDSAVALAPQNFTIRLARARYRISTHSLAAALEDLDAADKTMAAQQDQRLELSYAYTNAHAWAAARRQLDLWLKSHPEDALRGNAFNQRCWIAGLSGENVGAAMKDCDNAVRAAPKNPHYLDSRGLLKLRQGDLAGAISDYSASISIDPKSAWTFYGRAVAERKKGDANAAQKDFESAKTIAPKFALIWKSYDLPE